MWRKAELLQLLAQSQDSENRPIAAIGDQEHYARLRTLSGGCGCCRNSKTAPAYNIPLHQMLAGPLDVDAMIRAIRGSPSGTSRCERRSS